MLSDVRALRDEDIGTWEEVVWWDSWEEAEDGAYCDGCGDYVGEHGIWQSARLLCADCAEVEDAGESTDTVG